MKPNFKHFYNTGDKKIPAEDRKEFDKLMAFLPAAERTKVEEVAKGLRKRFEKQQPLPWTVIRASDALKLWAEYGRSDIINEPAVVEDMVMLTLENGYKILANTYNVYRMQIEQGWKNVANDPAYNEWCHWRMTDAFYNLLPCLNKLQNASTDSEKLMALDNTFNTLHTIPDRTMADWFIQGGLKTLDKIRDL